MVAPYKNLIAVATISISCMLSACSNNYQDSNNININYQHAAEIRTTLSGSYLSGRFAQNNQDWQQANKYTNQALKIDQENKELREKALIFSLGSGDFKNSRAIAKQVFKTSQEDRELALIFLISDKLANNSQQSIQEGLQLISQLSNEGFGYYTGPLLKAWSLVGLKKNKEALKTLENSELVEDSIYQFHAGLINDFIGNKSKAKKHFTTALTSGIGMHNALIIAKFYQDNGHKDMANMVYKSIDSSVDNKSFQISDNSDLYYINNINDGAALAVFDLASILYERKSYDSALIYSQIAHNISADIPFIQIVIGDVHAVLGDYNTAISKYKKIENNKSLSLISKSRIAEAFEMQGNYDRAIETLQSIAAYDQSNYHVLMQIGDIYKNNNKYLDAIKYYNDALSRIDNLEAKHSNLIYARGVLFDNINDWSNAEKDMIKALELDGNNPSILNYLGYAWTEKGVNLTKSLEMIKKALTLSPDDGYIMDSYGWALYKNDNIEEAVTWLEKALSYVPTDSTINEHLGDVYWELNRKREARFQWEHARKLNNSKQFTDKIDNKLKHGLKLSGKKEAMLHQ